MNSTLLSLMFAASSKSVHIPSLVVVTSNAVVSSIVCYEAALKLFIDLSAVVLAIESDVSFLASLTYLAVSLVPGSPFAVIESLFFWELGTFSSSPSWGASFADHTVLGLFPAGVSVEVCSEFRHHTSVDFGGNTLKPAFLVSPGSIARHALIAILPVIVAAVFDIVSLVVLVAFAIAKDGVVATITDTPPIANNTLLASGSALVPVVALR